LTNFTINQKKFHHQLQLKLISYTKPESLIKLSLKNKYKQKYGKMEGWRFATNLNWNYSNPNLDCFFATTLFATD